MSSSGSSSTQHHHQRNTSNRRDSPSLGSTPVSSRPRSNSKTSSEANQRYKNPATNCNGKMPSISNSTSPTDPITDGVSSLSLENCRYPVGSKIVAKLKSGTIVKGEVTAFDPSYKIIMIKSPGSRHGLNNASMLNLAHCVDIKVEEEGKDAPGELHSLNTDKLAIRLRDNVERKKRLVMAFKAGISPAGQRMFQAILKTIDDVQWNGENIVVMRDVTIAPPYRPDTIRGNQESQALLYVRKIVEKHISDQEAAAKIAGAAAASTPTSSMSSSTVSVDSTTTAPTSTSSTATTTTSATASTTATATSTTTTSSTTTSKPTGGGTGSSRTNRSSAGGGRSNNRYNHEHPKPMYNQ